MIVAVVSDEVYAVHATVVKVLEQAGHTARLFGAVKTKKETLWVVAAQEAAEAITAGECDEGIFFCFSGTGIAMAANKVPGIRAALCTDAETARAARIWNHANVLALSNRLTSDDLAKEIVQAWLTTAATDPKGAKAVQALQLLEQKYMKKDNLC